MSGLRGLSLFLFGSDASLAVMKYSVILRKLLCLSRQGALEMVDGGRSRGGDPAADPLGAGCS